MTCRYSFVSAGGGSAGHGVELWFEPGSSVEQVVLV
jgi:hypothetical protein